MNKEAFEKDLKYVYNIAFRLTMNPEESQDLAQETLLKAWQKESQLKEPKARKAWLRKICTNLFLMQKRKEKGYTPLSIDEVMDLEREGAVLQLVSPGPGPEQEIEVKESIREMRNGCFLAMTRKLTLNQRIMFALVDMFGVPIDLASSMIGVSKSAGKALLYRARLNLDSFFSGKCQWISEEHTCTCEAYLNFQHEKAERIAEVKKRISTFKFGQKPTNYVEDARVREKVKAIYDQIPDRKPNQEWFDMTIQLFEKNR